MIGDDVLDDVVGAQRVGMRGCLVIAIDQSSC
jgi:predicted HAD superfamily phosphohydrolase YqeG